MFSMQHYDITKCCNTFLINDREGVGSCAANELNGHPSLLFSVNLSLNFLHHGCGGTVTFLLVLLQFLFILNSLVRLFLVFFFSYYNLLCHFFMIICVLYVLTLLL